MISAYNLKSNLFSDYIDYLREAFVGLIEYRDKTGTLEPYLIKVKEDLFDDDPFVVFSASIAATIMLSDKLIYH